MAVKKYVQSELVEGSPVGLRIVHVCDTDAEKPVSGLNPGDFAITDLTTVPKLYMAVNATTWTLIYREGLDTLDFILENRTADPVSPLTGRCWLRTDL